MIRSVGALLTVLGLLCAALWAVRRYNLVLPGGTAIRAHRRLAVVERLSIDPRRSLALVRRDGVEHLVLLAPEGHILIESRIVGEDRPATAEPEVSPSPVATLPGAAVALVGRFGALVDRARLTEPPPPPRTVAPGGRSRRRKGRSHHA